MILRIISSLQAMRKEEKTMLFTVRVIGYYRFVTPWRACLVTSCTNYSGGDCGPDFHRD